MTESFKNKVSRSAAASLTSPSAVVVTRTFPKAAYNATLATAAACHVAYLSPLVPVGGTCGLAEGTCQLGLTCCTSTTAFNVTTFAGTGVAGLLNGYGYSAKFNDVQGLTFSNGIIYVADTYNHYIRAITSAGTVSTFAGTGRGYLDGAALSAFLQQPIWCHCWAKWNAVRQ